MPSPTTPSEILDFFTRWAADRPDVRAALLYSSRADPNAHLDRFSDYDVIFVVTDVRRYFTDKRYLEEFSRVLTVYKNPLGQQEGFESFGDITQYENGVKIDYTFLPTGWLAWAAAQPTCPEDLDLGYRVLVDKDGLAARIPPPTGRAYIPKPPTPEEFLALVEEFYAEAPYVAKNLRRDELVFWKYNLDHVMKFELLRKLLDWRWEIDQGWSQRCGAYGKGLKKRVPPERFAALAATYTGADPEENWQALFATLDLFHAVALEVAQQMGYPFPADLHERVVRYLRGVKAGSP
jgi:aminoglycoside 6-adenylyltransferase